MITLEKVKKYLSIFDDYDDELLTQYMLIAETYIDSCVGVAYKSNERGLKLSEILILKLVHDLYENRGTTLSTNVKRDMIVTTTLDILVGMGDAI